jgi:amino acid efflux transporter
MGEEGLEEAAVPSRLKRAITLRYAVAMYISSVLGAGILVIPGLAARIAGPGSLLSWLLLSLASYPFAYTFASLSSRKPESGGIYAFARESFGRRAATVVVWLFVAWIIFGAPAITLAAADYLAASLPVTQPETFVIAAGIMLFAFAINFGGIKLSGRVQLATVVAVILVLLGVVTFSAGNIKPSNFAPFLPSGIGSVGVASALIVWSFLGYENVSNVAEEFQDPKRDFGRSVVISVLVIGALYFVVALATIGTGAYAEGTGVAPFAVMASAVFGVYGGLTVSLLALFVIFGTFNAYTAGLARMFYAAARDGELPAMLGKVDTASGVPRRALLFLLAVDLSSLLAYYVLHLDIQTGFLGTSGAAVLTYLIGSAAGIRLLREGGLRRLLPWLSFAAAVALLFFVGSLLILSLAIVVLALFYSSLRSKGRPEPIEG